MPLVCKRMIVLTAMLATLLLIAAAGCAKKPAADKKAAPPAVVEKEVQPAAPAVPAAAPVAEEKEAPAPVPVTAPVPEAVPAAVLEPVAEASAAPALKLADFSTGTIKPFEKGRLADAPDGSARVLAADPKAWITAGPESGLNTDWSGYDALVVGVINPGQELFSLQITIKDPMNRGYWSWHNRIIGLAPGLNTIRIPMNDMWRGEVLRRDIEGMIDTARITHLALNGNQAWMLAFIQLEKDVKIGAGIANLKAFDVGKAGTPVLAGFTALTEKDTYSADKGFGWKTADFARMDDRVHPDDLFRDNLSCRNCELAIDLPNDTYRVHLQLEDPGAWEFMQHYTKRSVTAEGAAVVDETMDAEVFLARYYRNQDAEDMPGEDPFGKYVETRHPWHTFDVNVADGQLNLGFRCWESYGNTLSAVIIYPASAAAAGDTFMAGVMNKRRESWTQRWKPVAAAVNSPVFSDMLKTEAERDGFVLFAVSPDAGMDYNALPSETDRLEVLKAAACRGEFEPVVFGFRPARVLGRIDVTVSDLQGPAGAKMAAADIDVRVGRYRITRHNGHQSGMYTVAEKELRRFNRAPEEELTGANGMARRFWLTVRPAAGQAPGTYRGTVTVRAAKGGERKVPLEVTVLPAELPASDFLFTMYGIMLYPMAYYPEMKAAEPARTRTMYQDLLDHGINYIKSSGVRCDWKDGKAVITNLDEVRADMALRKELGFGPGPLDGPARGSLQEVAYAGEIAGQPRQEFIRNWYGVITDQFKAEGWPHPCFCFGDEPNVPETLNALIAAHNNLHAVSTDIWTEIAYHTSNPESYALVPTVDVQHFKRFCSVEDFKKVRAAGKYVIASNIGATRFAFGLWSWRAHDERGLDGSITFSYTGSHVDIYYDLDAREGDYAMAAPRRDGTFDKRADWERIREGIDDFRYARLLKNMAAAGGPKAAAAKVLLDKAYALGDGARASDSAQVPALNAWRMEVHALLAKGQ